MRTALFMGLVSAVNVIELTGETNATSSTFILGVFLVVLVFMMLLASEIGEIENNTCCCIYYLLGIVTAIVFVALVASVTS